MPRMVNSPDNPFNFEHCEECAKAINCTATDQFNQLNEDIILQKGENVACIYCGQVQFMAGHSKEPELLLHTRRCTAHNILHVEKITDIKIQRKRGFM
jgi:hypothetical protein